MFGIGKPNETNYDFQLFAIYDSAVQTYRVPFPEKDPAVPIRQFEKLYMDPSQNNNDMVTHAEHFSLFKIGDYESATGKIIPCNPEHIVNLHELRSKAHASMAQQAKVPDLRALSPT